jgi:cation diffusion facilitator CzcD-associated flavoprotein CzcO
MEHFDVIVIGAGLSGVGAACHLALRCPDKRVLVLEGRDAIGGTWDLFRYPGIRSDSDMFTLGYAFEPWTDQKAIADGPSIRKYVIDTAHKYGVYEKIRFQHRVVKASWSSDAARWTLEVERGPENGEKELVRFTCGFVYACTGYYDYATGHAPAFPGIERFQGTLVHPQHWPEGLDYAGKRVIVIGSGATAITLVPEMAKTAGHVVMLQRSPTYVASLPAEDAIANGLRKLLPAQAAYDVTRWKNVLVGMAFYQLARRYPEGTKRRLLKLVREQLGPMYDVEKHFAPHYKPWDQRLCVVPDNDLFIAIREGRASVVTDHIETFTENGIRTKSGQELPADIVVSATGLKILFLGSIQLVVDGKPVQPSDTMNYKGAMFSDVPNLACAFGYTNASWTLKADLTADFVCRLLKRMDEKGAVQVTPRVDASVHEEPFLDLTSGYVQRGLSQLPKMGDKQPWKLYQNYLLDVLMLRHGTLDDGALELRGPRASASAPLGATPAHAR